MPIRNPFAKRSEVSGGLQPTIDENTRLGSPNGSMPRFERADTMGSKASSALSIKSSQSLEPAEYKMSGTLPITCHTQELPTTNEPFLNSRQ